MCVYIECDWTAKTGEGNAAVWCGVVSCVCVCGLYCVAFSSLVRMQSWRALFVSFRLRGRSSLIPDALSVICMSVGHSANHESSCLQVPDALFLGTDFNGDGVKKPRLGNSWMRLVRVWSRLRLRFVV